MSGWSTNLYRPNHISICPWAMNQPVGDTLLAARSPVLNSAGAWPAANRAIFVPIVIEVPTIVYKLSMLNGAVAGEVDAGIYSYPGSGTSATRLASNGKVAMAGATTLQVFDIADTTLTPGNYFFAFVCSTVTTATFQRSTGNTALLFACGMAQQALAEPVLPSTATLAQVGSSYIPAISGIGRELY